MAIGPAKNNNTLENDSNKLAPYVISPVNAKYFQLSINHRNISQPIDPMPVLWSCSRYSYDTLFFDNKEECELSCIDCNGERLKIEFRAITINGKNIPVGMIRFWRASPSVTWFPKIGASLQSTINQMR